MCRQPGAGGHPSRANGLGNVGVLEVRGVVDPAADGAHLQRRVGDERGNGVIDHRRLDQRLISLYVDHKVACERRGDLRESIGPALVRARRHLRATAEGLDGVADPFVVGCHDDNADRAGGAGTAIDVLDHGAPADVRERFAREAGRIVTRWDDGNDGEGTGTN